MLMPKCKHADADADADIDWDVDVGEQITLHNCTNRGYRIQDTGLVV
jgi:hypothetical protein